MGFKSLSKLAFVLVCLTISCKNRLNKVSSLKPIQTRFEFADSTYFSFAWNIQKAGNFFFINDYKNNRVLKLDSSLNLIKSFGRFGRGPGEFQGAGSTIVNQDSIYVYDDAGLRFNVYNLDGNLIRTFKIPYHLNFARVALIGNRLFMSSPLIEGHSSTIFETDLKGNLIRFFDEDPSDNLEDDSEPRLLFSNEDKNQIISVPIGEPFIERYSPEGKILGLYNLRKIKKLKSLWDFYQKKAPKNTTRHIQVLFSDAYMQGSSLYILCSPWKGRDDFSYIIKLKLEDKKIKPVTVFKIQGTEPQMRLFKRLAVSKNQLIATEGFSNAIFKFDLSKLK